MLLTQRNWRTKKRIFGMKYSIRWVTYLRMKWLCYWWCEWMGMKEAVMLAMIGCSRPKMAFISFQAHVKTNHCIISYPTIVRASVNSRTNISCPLRNVNKETLVVIKGYQSTRHRCVFSESSRHMVKSSHSHLVTIEHCTKLRVRPKIQWVCGY